MLYYRSFMNETFGVTYGQLQPKLSLSSGPSAMKHGPNIKAQRSPVTAWRGPWRMRSDGEKLVEHRWTVSRISGWGRLLAPPRSRRKARRGPVDVLEQERRRRAPAVSTVNRGDPGFWGGTVDMCGTRIPGGANYIAPELATKSEGSPRP
jgi:hypothetical protein